MKTENFDREQKIFLLIGFSPEHFNIDERHFINLCPLTTKALPTFNSFLIYVVFFISFQFFVFSSNCIFLHNFLIVLVLFVFVVLCLYTMNNPFGHFTLKDKFANTTLKNKVWLISKIIVFRITQHSKVIKMYWFTLS